MSIKNTSLLLIFFFLFIPTQLIAKQEAGFHKGPYLLATGGMLKYDWDVNQRTLLQEGGTYEPLVGFTFGWNLLDWFAIELNSRYTTSSKAGRREHLFFLNLGPTFYLIWDRLLLSNGWNILPFVNISSSMNVAALPGDVNANDDLLTTNAFGIGLASGLRFQWREYLYLGIEWRQDFLNQPNKFQQITVGGNSLGLQKIYDGGWKTQFSLLGVVGVHY